jgi:hypothetical protein
MILWPQNSLHRPKKALGANFQALARNTPSKIENFSLTPHLMFRKSRYQKRSAFQTLKNRIAEGLLKITPSFLQL